MTLMPGDEVMIECELGQGAFPTEVLVTFDTLEGPVSGFVRKDNIVRRDDAETGYLKGTVKDLSEDVIKVLVKGSFFTTTGIAAFRRDDRHIQVLHAA